MEKRIVPTRNYIILGILIIATVVLTFYFVSWYEASKEYRQNNSVIADILPKITIEDIDNYLLDNPNTVIYMASSTDENIKDFEKQFKKLLVQEEISDSIVYIDTNSIVDNNYQPLVKRLSDTLTKKNVSLDNKTNLLIVRDGEIIDILYKDNTAINESDVEHFLDVYEVLEP